MALLNKKEREKLLRYAREVIEWKLALRKDEPHINMNGENCGAFVTLRKESNLRGCIGNIISERPLEVTVREMSEAAAFRDPRFIPLKEEEFDKISIEISILSPLKKIEDLQSVKPGRDGLYVRNGYHSGLLLPQVATEQDWDRETFIDHTFLKAGLSPDMKDDENTEVFSFTAEVFSEEDS